MFKEPSHPSVFITERNNYSNYSIQTFDDVFWLTDEILSYFNGKMTRADFDEWYEQFWSSRTVKKKCKYYEVDLQMLHDLHLDELKFRRIKQMCLLPPYEIFARNVAIFKESLNTLLSKPITNALFTQLQNILNNFNEQYYYLGLISKKMKLLSFTSETRELVVIIFNPALGYNEHIYETKKKDFSNHKLDIDVITEEDFLEQYYSFS